MFFSVNMNLTCILVVTTMFIMVEGVKDVAHGILEKMKDSDAR